MQFLGEARNRWEQIAFFAAISNDVSNLALVEDVFLDTQAGIVSWSWIIKGEQELPVIAQYLSIMSQLSYGDTLDARMLAQVHKGSHSLAKTMQNAIAKYVARYGRPSNEWLLSLGKSMDKSAWQKLWSENTLLLRCCFFWAKVALPRALLLCLLIYSGK
jgi:hypothetical protein